VNPAAASSSAIAPPQASVTLRDRASDSTSSAAPSSEGTYWPALDASPAKSGSIQVKSGRLSITPSPSSSAPHSATTPVAAAAAKSGSLQRIAASTRGAAGAPASPPAIPAPAPATLLATGTPRVTTIARPRSSSSLPANIDPARNSGIT